MQNRRTSFIFGHARSISILSLTLWSVLRPDVVLERFASEAPPRFQAGPTWGMIRNEQLWNRFERRLLERDTYQGKFFDQI